MLLILQLIPVYSQVVDEITDLLALISFDGIDAHTTAKEDGPRRLGVFSHLKMNEPTKYRPCRYVRLQNLLQFGFQQIYVYLPCNVTSSQSRPRPRNISAA